MKFLDFFAGIGTIRIGFEQAGWQCNGHIEWDKFAQASYNAMHDIKDGEYCGWDIRSVRADELPRSDLWAFGAPCQDFSIAGKRKGMGGERSSLVNEIFRLIEETPEENKPTWLLYENVKGMLSSNGGWDFLGILLEMDRLGYDVEWQLLNSKHFGVPQNRERVFTLGNFRGRGGRKVFPITGQGGQTCTEINVIGEELETAKSGNLEPKIAIPISSPDYQTKNQNGRRFKEDGEPMFTLTAQDRHGVMVKEATSIRETKDGFHLARNDKKQSSIQGTQENTVAIKEATKQGVLLAPNNWGHKAGDGTITRKRTETEIHPALQANCGATQATYYKEPDVNQDNGFRIRRLTPLECWRLQGIPDEYFHKAKAAGVSDSQLYKQAGNACTVNVIYEIAKRIGRQMIFPGER